MVDLVARRSDLQHGQKLYLESCAKCHQDKGRGISCVVPNLAVNAAVTTSARPNDVIDAVLNGLHGSGKHGTMPGFARVLKDQDVADIVNYVRIGRGNSGPTNATSALVASLRKSSSAGGAKSDPASREAAGSEAAPAFDCPSVGTDEIPNVMINSKEASTILSGNDTDMANDIDGLLYQIQKQHPGVTFTSLFDSLSAAYCPVVANQSGLTYAQKRALMAEFNKQLEQRVAAMKASAGDNIIAHVPLATLLQGSAGLPARA